MSFDNEKAVTIYSKKTKLFPIEERLFLEHFNKPGKLLDLGCGTGRTTKHLANMGHDVIGVDISPKMIEQARKIHPDITFHVCDAVNLKIPSCPLFDYVVFSFNGLDYVYPESNRLEALREIYSVMKPGGVFIFSTHSKQAMLNSGKNRNWRRKPRPYRGLYYKERTVYGDLITYYGIVGRNLNMLKSIGFHPTKFEPLNGRTWRYYTTWV